MTQKGDKVQIFIPDKGGSYHIKKAKIKNIEKWGGKPPDIKVLSRKPYVIKKVRHLDFMKAGKAFWCHRPNNV